MFPVCSELVDQVLEHNVVRSISIRSETLKATRCVELCDRSSTFTSIITDSWVRIVVRAFFHFNFKIVQGIVFLKLAWDWIQGQNVCYKTCHSGENLYGFSCHLIRVILIKKLNSIIDLTCLVNNSCEVIGTWYDKVKSHLSIGLAGNHDGVPIIEPEVFFHQSNYNLFIARNFQLVQVKKISWHETVRPTFEKWPNHVGIYV